MTLRLAIHQPNYIPWCGYFAKMAFCDVFVFLDDAEISPGQSYVYRAQIRNSNGPFWLSIPTHRYPQQLIRDVQFADPKWVNKHLNSLRMAYGKTSFFKEVFSLLEPIYQVAGEKIASFNFQVIKAIADYLGIGCRFELSSELCPVGTGDDRLISLAQLLNADIYVSGKGGQNYQDPFKFASSGIELEVLRYKPVPYAQSHGEFIPGLSIVDSLFHLGPKTKNLLIYVD